MSYFSILSEPRLKMQKPWFDVHDYSFIKIMNATNSML
jgi:hypothetical protein